MSVRLLTGVAVRIAQLTAEQRTALRAYASRHGRLWRASLLRDWETGRSQGELQQVRNSIGPSGLLKLKASDLWVPS